MNEHKNRSYNECIMKHKQNYFVLVHYGKENDNDQDKIHTYLFISQYKGNGFKL